MNIYYNCCIIETSHDDENRVISMKTIFDEGKELPVDFWKIYQSKYFLLDK